MGNAGGVKNLLKKKDLTTLRPLCFMERFETGFLKEIENLTDPIFS